jgi:hypothetical protein
MAFEMRVRRTRRKCQQEAGIALLIAIFILLLIGVVAIALVVSSGTESALAGNYRSSTNVYYAAVAGLEEVRARLRFNNPNSFNNTAPGFLPPPGTPLGDCNPVYVINPRGGEAITPWDQGSAYPDTQFGQEHGAACGGAIVPPSTSPTTSSVWNRSPLDALPFPGPLYKWVRINGVSEKSLNLDVDADGQADSITPLFYNGNGYSNNAAAGPQALELTALAVLPNGSQKLMQYLVAPVSVSLPAFPAALTISGNSANSVAFSAPASNANYSIKGGDQDSVNGCAPGLPVHAVGVFNAVDQGNVTAGGNGGTGIPAADRPNYTGSAGAPDVNLIAAVPSALQSPAQLEALVQTITQTADVVLPGPATGSDLPTSMYSPSPDPMTIVVNGDLDLTGWHQTGYGLLLVRGNLNYDPDASWDGVVMVVGKGTVTGSKSGSGELDGAFLLAKTLDAAGNTLSNFGTATMLFGPNMGGNGIRYSSCWVQASQPLASIKILSFHEISQ